MQAAVEQCQASWRARLKQAAATADAEDHSSNALAVVALSSPARNSIAHNAVVSPQQEATGTALVHALQTQLEAQAAEHAKALQQVLIIWPAFHVVCRREPRTQTIISFQE
jgi:hypothetical protein